MHRAAKLMISFFTVSDIQVITYAPFYRVLMQTIRPEMCFLRSALLPHLVNGTSNEYLMCINRAIINTVAYEASSLMSPVV